VDALVRRYLREVITQLGNHPAIWAWDLFNEAHLRSEDPWTVSEYRLWLERRYGRIANLNRHWHRRYATFEQVDPVDRMVPYSQWSSILPQVDWEHFRADLTTEVCRRWVGYARECDQSRPMIIDSTGCNLLSGDATRRNTDEFGVATTCDVYGGTYYPRSWGRDLSREPWTFSFHMAVSAAAARAAGVPFVVNELQTHTQCALSPGSEVAPRELVAWTWATLAAGSRATQLWRQRPFLHGYQATGRGLTRLDGIPGPRATAIASLIKRLRRHEQQLSSASPILPTVALMTGYRTRLIFDCFRGFEEPSRHPAALLGWWRLLWATGFPIAIGDIDRPDPAIANAPVIVLPSLIALSNTQTAWLSERVRAGALLIADARLATVDEQGEARSEGSPGAALASVFGCIERDVAGAVCGTFAGERFAGGFLSQDLDVFPGAEVVARLDDGRPLAVANRHGLGAAIYIAAHAGEVWRDNLPTAVVEWFAQRIAAAASTAPRILRDGLIQATIHGDGKHRIAYLISSQEAATQVEITGIGAIEARVLDGDTLTVCGGRVKISVPGWETVLVSWDEP
jgi:beta-galactosidase